MSPLASYIVLGFGSVLTLLGLFLLLTVLTRSPRAIPTLMVRGRAYRLRAAAVILVLSGGICFVVPAMHAPGVAPPEPTGPAERHGSPAPARSASHDDDRGSVGTTGRSAELDRPGAPEHSASPQFLPDDPFNLTGEWTVTNTVLETSYQPYRNLRLGFRVVVHQEGPAFSGTGEKYLENGRQIPVAARSPIRIQGRVATGSVLEVTFQEDGRARRVQGQFRLTVQDRQHLTGTFVSTAANARGASQWLRASGPGEPVSAGRRTTRGHRPGLQLGMSQTEVRDLLGAPVSVEDTPKFVFWHYGPDQYVAFEQGTGRVHGWVGVSS